MIKRVNLLIFMFVLLSAMTLSSVIVLADETYIFLECEECDDYTQEENIYGNAQNRFIKIESINVGGTFPGAWIMFAGVDFSGNGANKVAVSYAKKPDSCAPDTSLEFRLDSVDGELIADVPLTIAEGWGNYNLATADLKKTVTGKHDVYVVMKGTHSPTYVYIGQLDYVEFYEADAPASPGNTNNGETQAPSATPTQTASTTPTQEETIKPSQTQSANPSGSPAVTYTATPPVGDNQFPWIVVICAVIIILSGITVFIFIKKKNANV